MVARDITALHLFQTVVRSVVMPRGAIAYYLAAAFPTLEVFARAAGRIYFTHSSFTRINIHITLVPIGIMYTCLFCGAPQQAAKPKPLRISPGIV